MRVGDRVMALVDSEDGLYCRGDVGRVFDVIDGIVIGVDFNDPANEYVHCEGRWYVPVVDMERI